MKKAQYIGQVFIYILAVFLIGFVLVYGYNVIHSFSRRTNEITNIKFATELKSSIESIMPDYESVKIKEFFITPEYKEICFVSNYNGLPDVTTISDIDKYPIIKDSIISKSEKNVFLVDVIEKESYDLGKIKLEDKNGIDKKLLCIDVKGGRFRLRLEGKGNHVVITALD